MVTLAIDILSGPHKDSRYVFTWGKTFVNDIAYGGGPDWDPKSLFTDEESEAIDPNYCDPATRVIVPREPKPIRQVLLKLRDHLRSDGPSQLKMMEPDLEAAIVLCEQAIATESMVQWSFDN